MDTDSLFYDVQSSIFCILSSLYFGLKFYENGRNLISTVKFFLANFKNIRDVTDQFFSNYQAFDIKVYENKNLFEAINYLANLVSSEILVFVSQL